VIAGAVGAVEVVARTLAVLVVLVGAGLERLALGARASVVRLAVRARTLLRPGVLRRLAAVGLAGALLAIVWLAVMAGRAAWATTACRRSVRAAVAVGMGRFHWRTV
jgi:hypothetical protein